MVCCTLLQRAIEWRQILILRTWRLSLYTLNISLLTVPLCHLFPQTIQIPKDVRQTSDIYIFSAFQNIDI